MRVAAKKILATAFFIALQLEVLIGLLAVCAIHGLPIWYSIEYFGFQLLMVFVPGLAILSILRFRFPSTVALTAFSYGIGLAFVLCEYMLFMSMGAHSLLPLGNAVAAMVGVGVIIARRRDILACDADAKEWALCLIVVPIILTIDIVTVSCCNSLPSETGGTGYYVDWLFWAGNNISFTKSFPATNYRLPGIPFRYHHFSSMIMAHASLSTSIDSVLLTFYYSYFIPGLMLVLSASAFFGSFIKKNALKVLGVLMLLFTGGTTITTEWHIFFCPFGFDYGYIFGLLAVTTIAYMLKDDSWRLVLLSSVLIAVCTGCKGPVGIVILLGFGAFAVSLLIRRHWKRGFLCGLIWLSSFILVFLVFIYAPDVTIGGAATGTNGSGLQILGIKEAFKVNVFMQSILSELSWINFLPAFFIKAYCVFVFVLRANPVALLLFAVAVIHLVVSFLSRREILLLNVLFCVIYAFGAVLAITTIQSGGSQTYFIMSSIPFGIAAGLNAIDSMVSNSARISRLAVLNACMVLVLVTTGIAHYSYYQTVHNKVVAGYKCVTGQLSADDQKKMYYYISESYYDALLWVRDNTFESDMLAQDIFEGSDNTTTHMLSGVFSERYVWNDGKYAGPDQEIKRRMDLSNSAFKGDNAAIAQMKAEGVSYLLQMNNDAESVDSLTDQVECVFQNESCRIYRFL